MKRLISVLLALSVLATVAITGTFTVTAAAETSPVTLCVDGMKNRPVLSFDYAFTRAKDNSGQPASRPKWNTFVVRVSGVTEDKAELFEWTLNDLVPKNVYLRFVDLIDGRNTKTISLKNANCIRYTEYWDNTGTYYEEIELVASELNCNMANYQNMWN